MFHFIIADKTFNTDGSLYYPDTSPSSNHTSWVPEFFGNTITVNGVVWPKVNLKAQKYRFVFLNGCQSRFLNIYF
jgi:FtsP/CotA-like multicopper oxidase with cupredoxin domain